MVPLLTQVAFVLPVLGGVGALFLGRVLRVQISYSLFALGGVAAAVVSGISLCSPHVPGMIAQLPAFFLGIIGVGVFLASLYAIGYVPLYPTTYALSWVSVAYAAFIIGMQTVVLAPSVFTFLLGWETMSVAAYVLILADGSEDSMRAGLMYLVMTQLGFAAIASGMLLLSGGDPFASWISVAMHAAVLSPDMRAVAFVLLFAGFGSKAGLVPLHQWLPYAHPQAPSHVSALLSGVMLKVALFGFISTMGLLPGVPFPLAITVVVVGLLSAFFGALHAAVEGDAKRLLAWSSIENMGLIFSALGVILVTAVLPPFTVTPVVVAGATLFVFVHTINHSLFKTSLFLAAGTVVSATHTRDLDALGGLARRWPVFAGGVLALVLAAAALPPSSTFFGEWTYLQTLAAGFFAPLPIAAASVLMLGIIGLVAGLALFAFIKFFSSIFLGRARTPAVEHVGPLSPFLVVSPLIGALALFVLVPFGFPLLADLTIGATSGPFDAVGFAPGMLISPMLTLALVAGALALVYAARSVMRGRLAMRTTGTWDCGAPLTPRMEQTATGFAASIRFFFRATVLADSTIITTPVVATNPWIATKRLVWGVSSFWERRVYEPVVTAVFRISHRVRRLQGGVIQAYLFLVLAALLVVLAFSL
jgi:hydrogenase-4 component B